MVSIRQLKAARSLLGWSQGDLAIASGISEPTIARLEAAEDGLIGGRPSTRDAIIDGMLKAGVSFIDEGGGSVGVLLRRPLSQRK